MTVTTSAAPTNSKLALNQPTSASGSTQSYVPGNAVDGDTSTYWESTDNAFPQWFQVDLGSSTTVGRIVMDLPPSASWGARTQTILVQGSTDGTNYTTLAASTGYARHDAVSRTYFYQISTRKTALSKRYVWWIKEPLDLGKMQECAALIAGRHNFVTFRAPNPSRPGESTTVVVEAAEVGQDDHLIVFRIEASHFLWKMVRRLAGTLARVGLGEVTVEQFQGLLAGRKNPKLDIAAWTAPASGLFLESVRYS